MKSIKKSFQYGEHVVTLETGAVARQADGAVIVDMAETVVLVTAVGRKTADPGRDFFPLTVNYQEKTYAAGKIPGGFFKREGRPSEKETLVCRLIDRPIRPLFPKGFKNEVQVIATVMSLNPDVDPDIPALTEEVLPISNLGRIEASQPSADFPSRELFGDEGERLFGAGKTFRQDQVADQQSAPCDVRLIKRQVADLPVHFQYGAAVDFGVVADAEIGCGKL